MRILFLYTLRSGLTPRYPLRSLSDIHFGISYVAAYAKSQGHETRLAVLTSDTPRSSFKTLDAIMAEFDPQLIACSTVYTQSAFVAALALRLRARWPRKHLILGGVHSTLRPEEAIRGPFDAICVGEGELPLAEFAAQLQAGQTPHGIPNLWLKQADGTVEKNAPRSFLRDLTQLPFPDRAIWHDWVLSSRRTHHALISSRGCPYHCTYCSNHALRKTAPGKYVRLRPPAHILEEIRHLKTTYPEMTDLYLQSETIAVNYAWLAELTSQIKAFNDTLNPQLTLGCNFRVDAKFLTDEVFDALAAANVRMVEIGLESGSERLRREILHRNYSNADFLKAVALGRQRGMRVHTYNLIGLPDETPADHEMTVQANHQANPDRVYTSIFFPYPGTDLYHRCQADGLIKEQIDPTLERVRATLDFPRFPRHKVQQAYEWFEYKVYRGHRSLLVRWRTVVRNKLVAHHFSHYLFTRLLPLWYALRARHKPGHA